MYGNAQVAKERWQRSCKETAGETESDGNCSCTVTSGVIVGSAGDLSFPFTCSSRYCRASFKHGSEEKFLNIIPNTDRDGRYQTVGGKECIQLARRKRSAEVASARACFPVAGAADQTAAARVRTMSATRCWASGDVEGPEMATISVHARS